MVKTSLRARRRAFPKQLGQSLAVPHKQLQPPTPALGWLQKPKLESPKHQIPQMVAGEIQGHLWRVAKGNRYDSLPPTSRPRVDHAFRQSRGWAQMRTTAAKVQPAMRNVIT